MSDVSANRPAAAASGTAPGLPASEVAPTSVALTGTQALVRLVLAQAEADRRAGLDTAGLVSGYRGSPLGAVDQEMWRAKGALEAAGIRFQPAINEDLGATIVGGSQAVEADPERKVEGVFALWYGKGPGVDRSGDALRHGHAYGASPHGGVLVVVGDDHGCASSSMSHQSDLALAAWRMPVVHPASVAEYAAFGLWGFACSRATGAYVGLKAISETVESAATVPPPAPLTFAPSDHAPPPGGLHHRWPDLPGPQLEERLLAKLEAVRAFARANPLDRALAAPARPRLVIVTVGKAHLDAMEALRVGGLGPDDLAGAGVGLYKVGLVYPLDVEGLLAATAGAETVLVVEEKAAFVEAQLKEALFNAEVRPRVVGKRDEAGRALLSETAELRPSTVAPVLAARLAALGLALDLPGAWRAPAAAAETPYQRSPYFCPGCPHNTSTRVPEGSQARAGIGCHFMANWMDRDTTGIVQMGGEGADWVGQAPFTRRAHVFQNLGDGTYFHSGHLAIRQAVAAGANITYKILYNDAVAMTGGQPVDGALSVPQITRLAHAEGVRRVVVVADDPARHDGADLAPGVTVRPREELDAVQRALREVEGVTILVYDQTCAAEKRRRRKRGASAAKPARRVLINEGVCEGCGDCQRASNCLAVVPVDTPLGRKRRIDQSACNEDLSCVQGFCPSFVTVEGGRLRRGAPSGPPAAEVLARAAALPAPAMPSLAEPHEMLVAGVGGTGIVTVGALVVRAAQADGRTASVLDFMGFAQKGGAVLSHVRVAADPADLHQVRIDRGRANVLLAADLVVATGREASAAIARGRTAIVANTHELPTGAMLRDPGARIDTGLLESILARRVGPDHYRALDAQALAQRLLGDTLAANVLLLGFAWQLGHVPVSFAALDGAIGAGVAPEANRLALAWGRLAAADPDFVAPPVPAAPSAEGRLDALVAHRAAHLTAYQDGAYAARYQALVERVRAAGDAALTEAVAHNLHKLMAYKDEYEVARLYADGSFARQVAATFEGPVRLSVHLAPPLLARRDPATGRPRKTMFGPWMLRAFGVLARLKGLRGTPLDPFGYTQERRTERRLVADYVDSLDSALPRLAPDTREAILALVRLPEAIRGFGPVKEAAIAETEVRRAELLRTIAGEAPRPLMAAE